MEPENGTFSFPFMNKKKSVEELSEENEILRLERENAELRLSKAQKDALYKELDDAGMTIRKDFGGSIKRAWTWLNKSSKKQ